MKKNVLFKDFVLRFMRMGVALILVTTAFASSECNELEGPGNSGYPGFHQCEEAGD